MGLASACQLLSLKVGARGWSVPLKSFVSQDFSTGALLIDTEVLA
jgi:hypothetical protein